MAIRLRVTVDGAPHTVIPHDPARCEYFVSTSHPAEGAYHLCCTAPGRHACTCKCGQNGFRFVKAGACRHVRAALAAELERAAALVPS